MELNIFKNKLKNLEKKDPTLSNWNELLEGL